MLTEAHKPIVDQLGFLAVSLKVGGRKLAAVSEARLGSHLRCATRLPRTLMEIPWSTAVHRGRGRIAWFRWQRLSGRRRCGLPLDKPEQLDHRRDRQEAQEPEYDRRRRAAELDAGDLESDRA